MDILDDLLMKMISYNSGDPKRIQHLIKVHSFARLIGLSENLESDTQFILEAAAIVHDIGIKPAEEKYGYCNGKLQEQEGPEPAENCSVPSVSAPPLSTASAIWSVITTLIPMWTAWITRYCWRPISW